MKRPPIRCLLATTLSILTASIWASENANSLYVGQHKLKTDSITAELKGIGKVVGQNQDGYFRVVPTKGSSLERIKKVLSAKFDRVLPGNAEQISPSNLHSVENHIKYKRGIFKIKTGQEPKEGQAEELGVDFYEALEWYLEPRVDPATGELDRDAYIKAAEHRDNMPPATADMIDPYRSQTSAPAAWAFVGPKNLATPYQRYYGNTSLSGRKNMVTPAPSQPTIGYIASAGGGVWKTTNNYVSFTPLSDDWKFLHTTCVAVHPTDPNTVYVGTGDYEGFFTRQTFGIMKSTNGGATWVNQGAANFGDSVVNRIVIDPTNPNVVLALTAGPSGDIWRSTNGGSSWAQTNAPDADWQDIDRTASGYWIAVTGDGDRMYYSSSGASWIALTNPAGSGGTDWDIACSDNDYRRAYMIQNNGRVFRTLDNFVTWTDITAAHDAGNSDPSYNKSQITYDMWIETGVDSTDDSDIVYVGLITISASNNNGTTWYDLARSFEADSKWHNDQHNGTMWPSDKNGLLAVGDGGLTYVREDTRVFTDLNLNDGICDTQFYHIAVHPSDSLRAIGGTQDNASPMQRGANPNSNTTWFNAFAGDGAGCGFNVASPGIHYSSSQGGNFYRYDSAGDTTATNIGPGTGPFITPLVMGGTTRSTPTAISSNDMRKYVSGTTWTTHDTGGGTLRSIQVAKSNGNIIFTGATNGDVYRTGNFGTSFTKIDGTTLPNRAIGGFAESFATANWVICGLMGAGFADGAWRNTNTSSSTTWTNISGSGATALPAMPINDMERDPTNISVYYAATDVGVFVSPNEGANWYNMNAMGLPNVHVNDLWVYSSGGTNFLYAGTFGRGIWRCFLSARSLTSLLVAKSAIWGGQTNTFTVKMNGSAPAGSVAALSDNSGNVSIPASVTFPIGSTQVGFTAFTSNPAATQTVTVTATTWGSSRSASFTLHRIPTWTYTPASANLYGGRRFNATIQMSAPNPITAVYTFSDNAAQIGSPSATSIAAGQTTKVVPLYALAVASPLNATISCRLANTIVSSSVTIHPAPDLSSVSVSPNSVVGGSPSTGTVAMTFAGGGGPQTVNLTDSSTIVTTPSTVVVPDGATSANFGITTNPVGASYNVTIRARLRSISKTTILNVHP